MGNNTVLANMSIVSSKSKPIKVNFNHDGESFMSGGTDKQVIIWKTNFAKRKVSKENQKGTTKGTHGQKKEQKHKSDIYERIQNDVTTDVGARLGQPGQ